MTEEDLDALADMIAGDSFRSGFETALEAMREMHQAAPHIDTPKLLDLVAKLAPWNVRKVQ